MDILTESNSHINIWIALMIWLKKFSLYNYYNVNFIGDIICQLLSRIPVNVKMQE